MRKYEVDTTDLSNDHFDRFKEYFLPVKEYEAYAHHAVTIQHISNICGDMYTHMRKYIFAVFRHPEIEKTLIFKGF
jgi:hypothetical protein